MPLLMVSIGLALATAVFSCHAQTSDFAARLAAGEQQSRAGNLYL